MKLLRQRNFSENPEDVTIRIGNINNKKKLGELTDRQLENIAKWNNLSKDEKKNVRINSAKVILPSTLVGFGIGMANKGTNKSAAVGGLIGAGIGSGIVIGGDRLHKYHANAAEKVLEKRKRKQINQNKFN